MNKKLIEEVEKAYVAFKIGKITEREKDILVRGAVNEAIQQALTTQKEGLNEGIKRMKDNEKFLTTTKDQVLDQVLNLIKKV